MLYVPFEVQSCSGHIVRRIAQSNQKDGQFERIQTESFTIYIYIPSLSIYIYILYISKSCQSCFSSGSPLNGKCGAFAVAHLLSALRPKDEKAVRALFLGRIFHELSEFCGTPNR